MSEAQAEIEEEKKVEQQQPVQEDGQSHEELIEKFKNREIELYELPEELQSQLLDPTVEEIQLEESDKKEDASQEDSDEGNIDWKKRIEQLESKHKDLQGRYATKANEANAANQKLLSFENRIKNDPSFREQVLGAQTQDTKPENKEDNFDDIDVYDEEVLKGLVKKAQRVEELEKKLSQHDQVIQEVVGEKKLTKQQQEFESKYKQFEELQESVESLKTEMPFRKIDELYASFYNFQTNTPDIQSVLASGVSEEDFQKYQVLAQFNDSRYPTVRAAFRDSEYFESNQKQPNIAAEASKQALDSKVEKLQTQPKTLVSSYSTGSQSADKGTITYALGWLKDHPHEEMYGPDEMKEHARVMRILKGE